MSYLYIIPSWASILFLLVIPIPVYLVAFLAQKGANKSQMNGKRYFIGILLFYFAYFTYVTIACQNGAFLANTLPPAILVKSTIPLLIFLLGIFFFSKVYKKIIEKLSLDKLMSIHLFRLIGSFFIILYLFNALPKSIAFIAGIGDLVTAISSIFVARAIRNKKSYAKSLTYTWNTFGLLDIIATSATASILTKISIEQGTMGVEALAQFPFCFIPAFAPPTIIFLHLSVYRKLAFLRK